MGKWQNFYRLFQDGKYFDIALRVVDYYFPRAVITLGRSDILVLNGKVPTLRRTPKDATVRTGGFPELKDVLDCFEGDGSRDMRWRLFRSYLDRGARLHVVETKGKIVGYLWGFQSEYVLTYDDYVRSNIRLRMKEPAIFFGDGYVNPAYRMKGLWPFMMARVIAGYLEEGVTTFYANIDAYNKHSYDSHRRLGFQCGHKGYFMFLLGLKFFRVVACGGESRFFWVREKTLVDIEGA